MAEQDNQVQILNGTAAVSAVGRFMAKAGHWETGKAKRTARAATSLAKA